MGKILTDKQLDKLWLLLLDWSEQNTIDIYNMTDDWSIDTNDLVLDEIVSEITRNWVGRKTTNEDLYHYFLDWELSEEEKLNINRILKFKI
jgi:hypothetical protein